MDACLSLSCISAELNVNDAGGRISTKLKYTNEKNASRFDTTVNQFFRNQIQEENNAFMNGKTRTPISSINVIDFNGRVLFKTTTPYKNKGKESILQ